MALDWGTLLKAGSVAAAPATGGASLTPMLIGAALGAAKHFGIDAPNEKASRKANAKIMRYSPWTGIAPTPVREAPGLFSSALQGAALGNVAGGLTNGASAAAGGAAGAGSAGEGALGSGKMVADLGSGQAALQAGMPASPWAAPTLGKSLQAPSLLGGLPGERVYGGLAQEGPGSAWNQMKPMGTRYSRK
jgi:hypothetical protein